MRKLAGILEENAPQGFRWEFTRREDQTHNSVPHLGTYEGLEAVFGGWYLQDVLICTQK
jgi:hypothetical protein